MLREFLLIFGTIFLMEFADKTQLAAIGFSAKYNKPLLVYLGVVLGMAICTIISVGLGKLISALAPEKYLKIIIGVIFIAVGIWSIIKG